MCDNNAKMRNNFLDKKNRHKNQHKLSINQQPNPFSQDLTPWGIPQKLQASMVLLKSEQDENNQNQQQVLPQQVQHHQIYAPSIIKIQKRDSYTSRGSGGQVSKQKDSKIRNQTSRLYPKISSVEIQVQRKRLKQRKSKDLHSKSREAKACSKIANLTIQWDEDIIYNPQRKYLEEEIIKRKILKNLPSKNQNGSAGSVSIRMNGVKGQAKIMRGQFKNNKIHRKQQTVFQYRKDQLSQTLQKVTHANDFTQQLSQLLVKVNKIPKTTKQSLQQHMNLQKLSAATQSIAPSIKTSYNISEHRKFRTSLKSKRQSLRGKADSDFHQAKTSRNNRNKSRYSSMNVDQDIEREREIISKLTLQYNKDSAGLPFQIVARNKVFTASIRNGTQKG